MVKKAEALVSGRWYEIKFTTLLGKQKVKKFIYLTEVNQYQIWLAPLPDGEGNFVYRKLAIDKKNVTSVEEYHKQK